MWHLDEELEDWFEMVKERHEQERRDRDNQQPEDVDADLWENEALPERFKH